MMKLELDQKLMDQMGKQIELIYTDASGYDPCTLLSAEEYGITINNHRHRAVFVPWGRVKCIEWGGRIE